MTVEELKTDDRVLVIPVRDHSWIAAALERLTRGLLVGIGEQESVQAARRAFANADNAMFVLEDPDGGIPWRDSYFTVVLCATVTQEIRRVLATGGSVETVSCH